MRSVSEQITLFALMVTMGIVLGIIFDFYRAIRGVAEPGKSVTVIGDIIFWLIATSLVFSVLMWQTWGEMRAYVLIGLFLGFLIHWYYFSPVTLKLFRSLIFFIVWLGKIIWRIVSWPFITAQALLLPPVIYLVALTKRGVKVVGSKKTTCKSYINSKKNKCSNYVKNLLIRIFKRPPKND